MEFQRLLNPSPQLWISGLKFLWGQVTCPSCFATYGNAFSVGIAERFFRISSDSVHKEATALHSCLVRTSYQRPCRCHGPDQRNEVAPPHWITSSPIALSELFCFRAPCHSQHRLSRVNIVRDNPGRSV